MNKVDHVGGGRPTCLENARGFVRYRDTIRVEAWLESLAIRLRGAARVSDLAAAGGPVAGQVADVMGDQADAIDGAEERRLQATPREEPGDIGGRPDQPREERP